MWDERLGVVKAWKCWRAAEQLVISKQIEELEESRQIVVDVEEVLKQMTNEDVLSPLMDVDDEDNGGDT